MQVIYADTLFVINLIINYLILLATAKLCALQIKRLHILFGAALGAVYSVLTLLYTFCKQPIVKISVGVFMALVVFGGHKHLLRIFLTFFGVSAAFAGVIYGLALMTGGGVEQGSYIYVSFRMLMFAFGISYFIISIVFRRIARVSSETVQITTVFNGKTAKFTALKDTGHSLTDPITGSPVVIAGLDAIGPLFDHEVRLALELPTIMAVTKLTEKLHCFRLIPYSAVGVKNGMLAAFKPDSVRIGGREVKDCLVAVSPNELSDGGAYSALIGVD